MTSDKKSTQAVDKKLFADLQLTDEVIGNDYQADGVTVIGTCRIPLGDLLRKGLVVLDAPLATVNAANTVTATGPILGQTTDDKLVVKWAQTAGTDGWSTPFASTAQGALADTALQPSDVVDDLTTGGTAVPGSAEQLKVLKGQVDGKASTVQGVTVSGTTHTMQSAEEGNRLRFTNGSSCTLTLIEFTGEGATLYVRQHTNTSPTLGTLPAGMTVNGSLNFESLSQHQDGCFICVDASPGAQIIDYI